MLQKFQSELLEKKYLTDDVMLLKFKLPAGFDATCGQYMIFFVPNDTDIPYRRLYSIASDCSDLETCDIVAKIIPGGVASEYFKKLNTGDKVHIEGPAGVFQIKNDTYDKVFLATGTGIAPMKSMLYQLFRQAKGTEQKILLLWGLRTYADVYYFEELKKMHEENHNFIFRICLSRETSIEKIPESERKYFFLGRITDIKEPELNIPSSEGSNLTGVDYYLCGDRKVVESLRIYLQEKGIHKDAVIFEKF